MIITDGATELKPGENPCSDDPEMTIAEIECRLAWTNAAIMYWLQNSLNLITSWSNQ